LLASGSKIWLDSINPDEVARYRARGITGATSNPVIIADLVESGRYYELLSEHAREQVSDDELAWRMTDAIVSETQHVFLPVWHATRGDDGYVSFELDPLLEYRDCNLPPADRTASYIELGRRWSAGHKNRMIKVPNTESGRAALEELAAAGVMLNVTLTFTPRQYVAARDAIWRGARRRKSLDGFKSVYSIFVSRVDVYTQKHVPQLPPSARGLVGIVNAKRIWRMNEEFWADKQLPLKQEIVFASTGVKTDGDLPWKYVEAFAGSGIETDPPATLAAVQNSGLLFRRHVDELPQQEVLDEIDRAIDMDHMETTLMSEAIKKFAEPQQSLLNLIARQRASAGNGSARQTGAPTGQRAG
jgi:transaldolase